MRFKRSLIGYKTAETDSRLEEGVKSHQAAVEQRQSQLEELLTYQQHLKKQQAILDEMLQKARVRSDIFDSFSESLQQYFGLSEQRNQQEIQQCREAAAELEAALTQQGERVESDIIAWETFVASVEKHLSDLVTSLGPEFQASRPQAAAQEEVSAPESEAPVPETPEQEPIASAEIITHPVKPAAEAENTRPRRTALTTDDDPTILAILKVMLEREGFEVIQAADGRMASRLIDEVVPPDIVILDVMLPYVDGLHLTRQIRSKAEWSGTPILILSSNSTENEMVTLLDAGADDYVIKPFNTRELVARVKRLSEATVK